MTVSRESYSNLIMWYSFPCSYKKLHLDTLEIKELVMIKCFFFISSTKKKTLKKVLDKMCALNFAHFQS